jgi:hypothetical protein
MNIKFYYVNKHIFPFKAHFFFTYEGTSYNGALCFNIKDGYEVIVPSQLNFTSLQGAQILKEAVRVYKENEDCI